jgi:nucleoside 2-deoxyribosyltransferase
MTTSHTQKACPICKLNEQKVTTCDAENDGFYVECPRCGKFVIARTAYRMAENRDNISHKLTAWIRECTDSGAETPEIDSKTLKEVEAALPSYRVSEKQLVLLQALEKKTQFPGQSVGVISEFDYPQAWAESEIEFSYLLRSLVERNLIHRTDGPSDLKDSFVWRFVITAAGWEFLDKHEHPAAISNQVFVAMSFSEDLNLAWKTGIYPALQDAGYRPYRVDNEPHIDRIDLKIITEIKNSRFLVADVTQQRPGVYFEAGYALGLSLPVFWCVRSDDLKNVHFDTRQYNHIVWENEKELAEQLYFFVTALIGKGSTT